VRALLLLGALLALTGTGCPAGKREGTVSGKVTYKGKAVNGGNVNFLLPDKGIGSQATLDDSGKFTLPGTLAVGNYKVFIQPPPPKQLPPGTPSEKTPTLDIPKKYQDPKTTTASADVKVGPNDITIELRD